jgi:hypothetical protein
LRRSATDLADLTGVREFRIRDVERCLLSQLDNVLGDHGRLAFRLGFVLFKVSWAAVDTLIVGRINGRGCTRCGKIHQCIDRQLLRTAIKFITTNVVRIERLSRIKIWIFEGLDDALRLRKEGGNVGLDGNVGEWGKDQSGNRLRRIEAQRCTCCTGRFTIGVVRRISRHRLDDRFLATGLLEESIGRIQRKVVDVNAWINLPIRRGEGLVRIFLVGILDLFLSNDGGEH